MGKGKPTYMNVPFDHSSQTDEQGVKFLNYTERAEVDNLPVARKIKRFRHVSFLASFSS